MRAWQALVLAAIAGTLGLAVGSRPVQVAAVALIVLLLIGVVYRVLLVGDVLGSRLVPDSVIPWGGVFQQQIALTNGSRARIPSITVTDQATLPDHPHGYVTSLGAKRSVTWEVEVPCRARGRYRIGPVEARMSDPLGLFPVRRTLGSAASVLVLPRWVPLRRCALKLNGFMPGEARGQLYGEAPPAVASVREYTPGDSTAAIHWAATARLGHLMTKLFDPEVQTTVWLALDLDSTPSGPAPQAEELLVTVAASLGTYALARANLRVGLLASGMLPARLPSERGRTHLNHLQEVLAEVHTGDAQTLGALLAHADRQFGPGQVLLLLTARGPDTWSPPIGRLLRKGVAVRVFAVGDQPAHWGVPSVTMPARYNEEPRERALISILETGRDGEDAGGE